MRAAMGCGSHGGGTTGHHHRRHNHRRHRWPAAAAVAAALAGLLAPMPPARALTIGPGDLVYLPFLPPPASGGQAIDDLVLAGGIGMLVSPGLRFTGTTTLDSGSLQAGLSSGLSGTFIRIAVDLAGPTVLRGSVVLDGGFPGDGKALATTNQGLLRQVDAGALALWTLSSFSNAGIYQIENDLGITHQDIWAALDQRAPYIERFTNTGTFSKIGGAGTSVVDMAFDNTRDPVHKTSGQVVVATGTLRLQAGGAHSQGSFSTGTGAALELGGLHTLADGNVFDGSTRVLAGGTLRGLAGSNTELFAALDNSGTVELRDGGQMQLAGRLRNASGSTLLVGPAGGRGTAQLQHTAAIANEAGASTVVNGQLFTDSGGAVANAGTLALNGHWTLNGALDNAAGGVAQFHAGSEVVGSGSLANAGRLVVAEGASVTLGTVTQTGGRLTIDGTLGTVGGDLTLLGGVLDGNGSIQGNLVAGGASVLPGDPPRVFPGHSPGHLSVAGSFRLLAGAELQLQVERAADGSLAWDSVSAGSFSFEDGSWVHLVVSGGGAAQWQTLDLLDCGSGCSFASGVRFSVDGAPGADLQFGAAGLRLTLAPAVPEPAAAWLALAGLALLAHRARRVPGR